MHQNSQNYHYLSPFWLQMCSNCPKLSTIIFMWTTIVLDALQIVSSAPLLPQVRHNCRKCVKIAANAPQLLQMGLNSTSCAIPKYYFTRTVYLIMSTPPYPKETHISRTTQGSLKLISGHHRTSKGHSDRHNKHAL